MGGATAAPRLTRGNPKGRRAPVSLAVETREHARGLARLRRSPSPPISPRRRLGLARSLLAISDKLLRERTGRAPSRSRRPSSRRLCPPPLIERAHPHAAPPASFPATPVPLRYCARTREKKTHTRTPIVLNPSPLASLSRLASSPVDDESGFDAAIPLQPARAPGPHRMRLPGPSLGLMSARARISHARGAPTAFRQPRFSTIEPNRTSFPPAAAEKGAPCARCCSEHFTLPHGLPGDGGIGQWRRL